MESMKCSKCGVIKLADQFYWRKDSQKYRTSCKECVASRNMKREKHWLEASLIHSRIRARKHGAHYENFKQHKLRTHWKSNGIDIGRCFYCKSNEANSIDHYICFKKGGEHVMINCRPACRKCNSRKHTKDPDTYQKIADSGFSIKWCSRCESTKELSEFHTDRARFDGKYKYCKPCQSKIATKGTGPHYTHVHTCPHCGLVGKGNIMLARHFENCKSTGNSL